MHVPRLRQLDICVKRCTLCASDTEPRFNENRIITVNSRNSPKNSSERARNEIRYFWKRIITTLDNIGSFFFLHWLRFCKRKHLFCTPRKKAVYKYELHAVELHFKDQHIRKSYFQTLENTHTTQIVFSNTSTLLIDKKRKEKQNRTDHQCDVFFVNKPNESEPSRKHCTRKATDSTYSQKNTYRSEKYCAHRQTIFWFNVPFNQNEIIKKSNA